MIYLRIIKIVPILPVLTVTDWRLRFLVATARGV
jgi:hypothetical protein